MIGLFQVILLGLLIMADRQSLSRLGSNLKHKTNMKRLLIPIAFIIPFTTIFIPTQANQQTLKTDPCVIEAQVAYNRAFQAEYIKEQNLEDADQRGTFAYLTAFLDCWEASLHP